MADTQRILLVDDCEVNRIVAMKHLLSVGYTVDQASDGRQALDAFRRQAYDLVLMDIEMPGMNGWEASTEIRRFELEVKPAAEERVPIVAMSGHALDTGDPRVRQAGISDSLAKPIVREQLLEAVAKWRPPQASPPGPRFSGPASPGSSDRDAAGPPIDLKKAVAEFLGEAETLQRVLQGFVEQGHAQIESIEAATASADLEKIRRAAHALKGGAANLTALVLAERCARVEEAAAGGDQDPLRGMLDKLKAEFDRLTEYVHRQATASMGQ